MTRENNARIPDGDELRVKTMDFRDIEKLEDTLIVSVDGVVCDAGWTWRPEVGAVVFDRDGACFPDFDAQVELA